VFTVAVMAYLALNCLSPPYLDQLVRVADLPGRHRLRSSSSPAARFGIRLATVSRRLFPVAASVLWNNLPPDIQSSTSLTDSCRLRIKDIGLPITPIISRRFALIIHVLTSLPWTV